MHFAAMEILFPVKQLFRCETQNMCNYVREWLAKMLRSEIFRIDQIAWQVNP